MKAFEITQAEKWLCPFAVEWCVLITVMGSFVSYCVMISLMGSSVSFCVMITMVSNSVSLCCAGGCDDLYGGNGSLIRPTQQEAQSRRGNHSRRCPG